MRNSLPPLLHRNELDLNSIADDKDRWLSGNVAVRVVRIHAGHGGHQLGRFVSGRLCFRFAPRQQCATNSISGESRDAKC